LRDIGLNKKIILKKILAIYDTKLASILNCCSWRHPKTARELISGPCLGAKATFLSVNRTQSRAVTGLLTGHNTLRGHLHLLGLLDTPLCRRCGVKEETSAHIHCACGALASFRPMHLGSFFLELEDIKSIIMGAIWNFSKVTGLP
jgi:hypothetical protein